MKIKPQSPGKNNGNYKTGKYIGTTARKKRRGTQPSIEHRMACMRYKNNLREEYGYLFCEVCKVNDMQNIIDAHHIYFASRYPKHLELHNYRNMICVCRSCHSKLHHKFNRKDGLGVRKEYQEIYEKLVSDRDLINLFNQKI
jgi:hypothetical protein